MQAEWTLAAGLVLTPGAPLGLLTDAVQTLAGVLVPSVTVFLLLLCNDKNVLGPWVNGRWLNVFTCAVIGVLVILSIILTASVMLPDATDEEAILAILGGGDALTLVGTLAAFALRGKGEAVKVEPEVRACWRMPPLHKLPPARLSRASRLWMSVLRFYLVFAGGLVLYRIVMLALTTQ
ncbi:hypothetical protein M2323_004337 [Rhodoblastus acidophilus]|nr:hypothetical protein [Rhodoblastus acidophilus]MCW2286540.1 hypothetical protein [Rhodoblastus acidophilus]MCW2335389.1 hypothetical protein [Rhodoblastus acidophilus]